MVETYAEASTIEEALEIKKKIRLGVFFGIDYIDGDGIPHLIRDNGGFLN
jgi:hypothetical protein